MTSPRILLHGGHGRVSQLLSPLLLSKGWNITSVIRSPSQEQTILNLGKGQPGTITPLVHSLEEIKTSSDAQRVVDAVKPDYIVFAAGAPEGAEAAAKAVDEVAAKAYISAACKTPFVKKFLLVSYLGCSATHPAWWSEADKAQGDKVNVYLGPNYRAKLEADEHLLACAHKRVEDGDTAFQAINLRPGWLTDNNPTGKVTMGRTTAFGDISRADVAAVAAALLERNDTKGWYDLLGGEDGILQAIDALVKQGWTGLDGQDLERIYARPTEF